MSLKAPPLSPAEMVMLVGGAGMKYQSASQTAATGNDRGQKP